METGKGLPVFLRHLFSELTFKLEYLYNDGPPEWLSRMDPLIERLGSDHRCRAPQVSALPALVSEGTGRLPPRSQWLGRWHVKALFGIRDFSGNWRQSTFPVSETMCARSTRS